MINNHQPKLFGPTVRAAVSSRLDGNMKFGGTITQAVIDNRQSFFDKAGILLNEAVLVSVGYDRKNFTEYKTVGHSQLGQGMGGENVPIADALATNESGVALFLPLADCVGAIVHDPVRHVLMVSHLGRHSLEQNGAQKSVAFMASTFASNPNDLLVWLSPAAGKAEYPLYAFNHRSMHEVIHEQLQTAGIPLENIETSPVDTARTEDYFSHSQFLKGNRTDDGRFAIVAMMLAQGEPAK